MFLLMVFVQKMPNPSHDMLMLFSFLQHRNPTKNGGPISIQRSLLTAVHTDVNVAHLTAIVDGP